MAGVRGGLDFVDRSKRWRETGAEQDGKSRKAKREEKMAWCSSLPTAAYGRV
jgi:hypothetical protein